MPTSPRLFCLYFSLTPSALPGVWCSRLPRGFQEVIVHAIDLLVFVAVVFLTRGPTSPFFVFFTFSLVCAALRWQSKGTLLTTVVALTTVILMALFPTDLFREPGFELNRFIVRIAYLAVVGTMLAYLASHEQRLRIDLSRLTAWPRIIPDDIRALARESLERTAAILGTRRVLLAWEEREEPWLHLAWWSADAFEYDGNHPPPSRHWSQNRCSARVSSVRTHKDRAQQWCRIRQAPCIGGKAFPSTPI